MNDVIKNIFRFVLFIGVQVYVLNKLPHLHRYIIPYLYFLFLLWLPFSVSRLGLLVIGFLTGLTMDYLAMTPGLHTAACVLIAYARPFVINILIPKDPSEFNYSEPSPKALGWAAYTIYALVLTFLHHGYLVLLQLLQFGRLLDFLVKIASMTGISLLLIFTVELLFPRKLRFRTNTP